MYGSMRGHSKLQTRLSACGAQYVRRSAGVARKLRRLNCEILEDVLNGVGR